MGEVRRDADSRRVAGGQTCVPAREDDRCVAAEVGGREPVLRPPEAAAEAVLHRRLLRRELSLRVVLRRAPREARASIEEVVEHVARVELEADRVDEGGGGHALFVSPHECCHPGAADRMADPERAAAAERAPLRPRPAATQQLPPSLRLLKHTAKGLGVGDADDDAETASVVSSAWTSAPSSAWSGYLGSVVDDIESELRWWSALVTRP